MFVDWAVWVAVLLLTAVGILRGHSRDFVSALGISLGYLATPWLLPRLTPFLEGQGLAHLEAALVGAAACLAVPGGIAALAAARALPPSAQLGARGNALVGGVAWLSIGVAASLAVLGAAATCEPGALIAADMAGLPLRSSRLYAAAERYGLLRAPAAVDISPKPSGPVQVLGDRRDRRVQAALADPTVRHAIETGDVDPMRRRNALLSPVARPQPLDAAAPQAMSPPDDR